MVGELGCVGSVRAVGGSGGLWRLWCAVLLVVFGVAGFCVLPAAASTCSCVYITNAGQSAESSPPYVSGTVQAYQYTTSTWVATITGFNNPPESAWGIAVTPDGQHAYVSNPYKGWVAVLDLNQFTLIQKIKGFDAPRGVAITPDGSKVYVANHSGQHVAMIDTGSNTVTGKVDVGSAPYMIAISQDGSKVYATLPGKDKVAVIDASTGAVTKVSVGDDPYGVAVTPDGSKVYVANYGGEHVSIIDTADYSVSSTQVGEAPWGVAITPDGQYAYVTLNNNNTGQHVAIVQIEDGTMQGKVQVGLAPKGIAITPDGKYAYVANWGWEMVDNSVSLIDITNNNAVTTVPLTVDSATGVAITPASMELRNKRIQKPRYLRVKVRNGTVTHTTKITGIIKVAGQRFRLAPRWVKLQAGEVKVVKLRFKGHKRAVKQIKKLLTETPGRSRVLVRASSVGGAPPITDRHWVRLQR